MPDVTSSISRSA